MNPNPDSKIAEPAKQIIGLKITIRHTPIVVKRAYPPHNLAGVHLLRTLLANALLTAGIVLNEAVSGGEFNDSLYYFFTSERKAAGIIEYNLKTLGLLRWAQIAWFDADEGIWRNTGPETRVDFEQFGTPEIKAHHHALQLEYEAAMLVPTARSGEFIL